MQNASDSQSKFSLKGLLTSTGALARKKAALAKLETTTLVKLYLAVGRCLQAREDLPTSLMPLHDEAKRIAAETAKAKGPDLKPDVQQTALKAKSLLTQLSGQIANATAHVRLSAAQVRLGAEATKIPDVLKQLPQALQSDLVAELRKAEDLKRDIFALGTANRIRAVTPKRLFVAGVVAAACLLMVFVLNVSSGSPYARLAVAMKKDSANQYESSKKRTTAENDKAADSFNARFTRMAKSCRVPKLEIDPAVYQVLKAVRLNGTPSVEARFFGPHLEFFLDVTTSQPIKRWGDSGLSVRFLDSSGRVIEKSKLHFKAELSAGEKGVAKFSTNDFDAMASVAKFRLVVGSSSE